MGVVVVYTVPQPVGQVVVRGGQVLVVVTVVTGSQGRPGQVAVTVERKTQSGTTQLLKGGAAGHGGWMVTV